QPGRADLERLRGGGGVGVPRLGEAGQQGERRRPHRRQRGEPPAPLGLVVVRLVQRLVHQAGQAVFGDRQPAVRRNQSVHAAYDLVLLGVGSLPQRGERHLGEGEPQQRVQSGQ